MNDTGALWFPPALLSVAEVSPQLLQGLFAAAADFFEIQPWKVLKGERVIEVGSPEPRLVVVMGAAGQSFGVSVYDSPADLQRMYQAQDPLEAAEMLCWLALTYETAEYLDQGDLQAIHQYGWRVASEAAYPSIARIGSPGPDLRPPTLQDLFWLEGCLRALCELFTSCLVLDEQGEPLPVDLTIPIQTSAGLVETRLHLPGMQVT
jgi:hypothetical protein